MLFPISQMCKTEAQCVSGLMSFLRGAPSSRSSFPGQSPDKAEILSASGPANCFKAVMLIERIPKPGALLLEIRSGSTKTRPALVEVSP